MAKQICFQLYLKNATSQAIFLFCSLFEQIASSFALRSFGEYRKYTEVLTPQTCFDTHWNATNFI